MSGKTYICLDIGGTYIKHGLLTEEGKILKKGKTPTRAREGGQAVYDQAAELVAAYLRSEAGAVIEGASESEVRAAVEGASENETNAAFEGTSESKRNAVESEIFADGAIKTGEKQEKISGIAISTAGMVDPKTGTILHASDAIPGYAGICYKTAMEERFHLPCEVENDVNCAGLAESLSGAGKGSRINLCLTVGTGIGGCLVVDGRVFHGASNSACEVGYMHLAPGAFQDEAAASALVRRVTERKKEENERHSAEGQNSWQNPMEEWDGIRIFAEAKKGDPICCEELDRLADLLGMGIANICFVVNPERIILGGGIMEQEAYMKPRIEAALEKYLVPQIWKHTTVCMAAYQNDAGMLGALYHFQEASDRNVMFFDTKGR